MQSLPGSPGRGKLFFRLPAKLAGEIFAGQFFGGILSWPRVRRPLPRGRLPSGLNQTQLISHMRDLGHYCIHGTVGTDFPTALPSAQFASTSVVRHENQITFGPGWIAGDFGAAVFHPLPPRHLRQPPSPPAATPRHSRDRSAAGQITGVRRCVPARAGDWRVTVRQGCNAGGLTIFNLAVGWVFQPAGLTVRPEGPHRLLRRPTALPFFPVWEPFRTPCR